MGMIDLNICRTNQVGWRRNDFWVDRPGKLNDLSIILGSPALTRGVEGVSKIWANL